MAYDPQNIFAKILRGELPCTKVYEDELTLAFMDVMPQADGHTLVIPKESAEGILDISPGSLDAAIRVTQCVARAVKQAMQVPGILIAQTNGAAAGQSVPHLHFHVIPRKPGEPLLMHATTLADPERLKQFAARITAALAQAS
ncbi:MAG: HIT family protein [Rhodocyclaceae bacterium]|jgi:histidine triad (HIT) family protein|nr:HIT family protein [Rhodocyclaceae bacterium]